MSLFTLKNGEHLYYEDAGSGDQTIVMLHGWTSSHEVFAPAVPEISRHARVITYDHRGHGGSKDANSGHVTMETLAGDLHELMKGLSLHDITLLGWSMGAGVVLNYVRLYGCGEIRRIILCDMTPKQVNDEDWKLGLYKGKYTRENMERDAGRDFYSLYREFAVGAIPRLRFIPGFLLKKPLTEKLAACNESVLKSLGASMKSQDNRSVVGSITVPVTYFYADPGSLFSPELAEWYRQHVHTAFRSVCFPKSTHMLISDNPEKFAKEVIQILEEK